MRRYEIVNEFNNNIQGREDISVVDPTIDKRMLLTSVFTRINGEYEYKQDVLLNRYDLNNDILDEIISKNAYAMLWVIDPRFLKMDTAAKLALAGGGEYLPDSYKKIWEYAVLRYIAGERDFYNHNDFYTEDRLVFDSDYAAADLDGYILNFISEYPGYVERANRGYILEEMRKDSQVEKVKKLVKR